MDTIDPLKQSLLSRGEEKTPGSKKKSHLKPTDILHKPLLSDEEEETSDYGEKKKLRRDG
jgi:hypothetical protein